MTTYYTYFHSKINPILLTSNGTALTGLYMTGQKHGPEVAPNWVCSDEALPFAEAKRQLVAYFAGTRTEFDLPLAPQGTDFQRRVWAELSRIAYGQTISYGELARRIGQPGSARAVGLANGRNPISIIVPCHRVIGTDGKLVGYGGGLSRKQALLSLETKRGCHPTFDFETAGVPNLA